MLQIQPVYKNKEAFAALAAREGFSYEVLELSMPHPPGFDPEVVTNWYRTQNKTTSIHGLFIDVNPASGNKGVAAVSKMQMRESCELAKGLGAENVVFHCSCFPFLRAGYLEFWAETCAQIYRALADEFQLNLFIENSMDVDPTPLRTLMAKTDHPNVQVCLDLGHANYSRVKPETWIDELGDHIGYIHLSDNMGRFDDHLPIGEGTVNWINIDAKLKSLNKNIPATLEVGDINGIEKSLTYIKTNHLFGY